MTTQYLLDGPEVVLEQTGSTITWYLHGPGLDELLASTTGSTTRYYCQDGLGSIIAITDATGTLLRTYTYEPFGTIRQQTGSLVNPWTFTGRPLDLESGLYFLRHRYYDPRTGTFITQDPIGTAGGINLYAYVKNSPVNFTDPFGWERQAADQWVPIGSRVGPTGEPIPIFVNPRTGQARVGFPTTTPGASGNLAQFFLSNPAQTLRWLGRVLTEAGYPDLGQAISFGGMVLEPSTGSMIGGAVFGGVSAGIGRGLGGAVGGIVGGIVGGTIGGAVGGYIDPYPVDWE